MRHPTQIAWREAGYNLAFLMALVLVMNVAVAVALPTWTYIAKKNKEEELVFRGLQYAEAIRIFQKRHGRPPTKLDELIELEPRAIRQLWTNPMREDGQWGLLLQEAAGARGGRQGRNQNLAGGSPGGNQRTEARETSVGTSLTDGLNAGAAPVQGGRGGQRFRAVPPSGETDIFGDARQNVAGPIVGVYAAVNETGLRVFDGSKSYDSWHFATSLIPVPVAVGGEAPIPRVNSEWIGKPFIDGITPDNPLARLPGQGNQNRGGQQQGSRSAFSSPNAQREPLRDLTPKDPGG